MMHIAFRISISPKACMALALTALVTALIGTGL
jgi:hypothetical protein